MVDELADDGELLARGGLAGRGLRAVRKERTLAELTGPHALVGAEDTESDLGQMGGGRFEREEYPFRAVDFDHQPCPKAFRRSRAPSLPRDGQQR